MTSATARLARPQRRVVVQGFVALTSIIRAAAGTLHDALGCVDKFNPVARGCKI